MAALLPKELTELSTTPLGVDILIIQEDASQDVKQIKVNTLFNDINNELTSIETGAGLNEDGSYISETDSNYINDATSLKNADKLLDIEMKKAEGQILVDNDTNTVITGGRYWSTGTPVNAPISGEFLLEVLKDGDRVLQVASFEDGSTYTRLYDTAWGSWEENLKFSTEEKETLSTVNNSGASADRPSSPVTGQMFLDTEINKPIWYNSSDWIDATGTVV